MTTPTMFHVFAGDHYSARGGVDDLIGTTHTLEEAIALVERGPGDDFNGVLTYTPRWDWAQICFPDPDTGELTKNRSYQTNVVKWESGQDPELESFWY